MIDGVLVIDKPAGPGSHAVVQWVRRVTGAAKAGHLGTLDPPASGVLPIALGSATSRARELSGSEKVYEFTLRLGFSTETDDDSGLITAEAPVPRDAAENLQALLPKFTGDIMQRPPEISAVKVSGVRAYRRAREEGGVSLEPRPVRIDSIRIIGRDGAGIRMHLKCRSGTYVRSLARDMGRAMGTLGYASDIRRLKSGPYIIDGALNVTELVENPDIWRGRLISV